MRGAIFGAGLGNGNSKQQGQNDMKRYMIERDIPGIGDFSVTELCGAARASNQALATIGPDIQWQHSYVVDGKLYCVYQAPDEELIREHARMTGIPCNVVSRIQNVIEPDIG